MLKKLRRIYGELRIWIKFLLVIRDPNDTPKIFEMIDLIVKYRGAGYFKNFLDRSFSSKELKEQFDRKYIPKFPTREELLKLPKETLGRILIDGLDAKGLELNFFPNLEYSDPIKYIIYRAYLVHDISHILLEYDTSLEEELALQGFTFAQTHSPISALLMAGGFINIASLEPQNLVSALRKMKNGYAHGDQSFQVFAIPFDECLGWTLEKIRQHYGIPKRAM